MIKAQVIGNLGKDAVVNNVNGKNVINFSVAHSEKFKNAQGVDMNKTVWVECQYWTDRTGVAPYLKSGTQVYVDGRPDVRIYKTSQGETRASFTLTVASIQLLGSSENRASNGNNGSGYQAPNSGNYGYSNNYAQRVGHGVQGPSGQIEQNGGGYNSGEITEPLDDLPF